MICICLQTHLDFTCKQHPHGCPDQLFVKTSNGVGIPIWDGTHIDDNGDIVWKWSSYLKLDFCPFCGLKLID